MKQTKLVVIGGGAAGFFCAINAARLNPQLKVMIIEKSNKLLSKVKVSGGGRCNTTHACFDIPELVRRYPRGQNFIKKSFHWFNTNDTITWFAERGVELKTESDGRMFPITNDSQTIINCLLKEADKDSRSAAEVAAYLLIHRTGISGDGSKVFYSSLASNLMTSGKDYSGDNDIYMFSRQSNLNELVSSASSGMVTLTASQNEIKKKWPE